MLKSRTSIRVVCFVSFPEEMEERRMEGGWKDRERQECCSCPRGGGGIVVLLMLTRREKGREREREASVESRQEYCWRVALDG